MFYQVRMSDEHWVCQSYDLGVSLTAIEMVDDLQLLTVIIYCCFNSLDLLLT